MECVWVAEEIPNLGEKPPGANGALELAEVPWGYKPSLPVSQHSSICILALSVQQEMQIYALTFTDGRILR